MEAAYILLVFFAVILNIIVLVLFFIMYGNVRDIKKQQIEHLSKLQKNQEVLRKMLVAIIDKSTREKPEESEEDIVN